MVHSLSQLKDYMVEKNRKLKEQFAAAARAGSTGTERHRVGHVSKSQGFNLYEPWICRIYTFRYS